MNNVTLVSIELATFLSYLFLSLRSLAIYKIYRRPYYKIPELIEIQYSEMAKLQIIKNTFHMGWILSMVLYHSLFFLIYIHLCYVFLLLGFRCIYWPTEVLCI